MAPNLRPAFMEMQRSALVAPLKRLLGPRPPTGKRSGAVSPAPDVRDSSENPKLDTLDGFFQAEDPHAGHAEVAEPRSPEATRPIGGLPQGDLERFSPCSEGRKALFLDYDGTLREFEAKPELATPTQELLELLGELDARGDLATHIISGRDARFLEEHLGRFSHLTLVAEHGFEISPAANKRDWQLWEEYGGNTASVVDHEGWKKIMRRQMQRYVQAIPGSSLEEKRSSLVWHYREVADQDACEAYVAHVVDGLEAVRRQEDIRDVKILRGHKVVEVSYRNVRKGLVMARLCQDQATSGRPFAAVLAAGDDVSDETMFDAAGEDFLTIKVGTGATAARFRASSPQELRGLLKQIASDPVP